MLTPAYTKQFKKDLKRMTKSGKNKDKLKIIIEKLINEEKLEEQHKDHKLIGNYNNRKDCHIEPDWLLIYKITDDEIIFERTGSHTDLFR